MLRPFHRRNGKLFSGPVGMSIRRYRKRVIARNSKTIGIRFVVALTRDEALKALS